MNLKVLAKKDPPHLEVAVRNLSGGTKVTWAVSVRGGMESWSAPRPDRFREDAVQSLGLWAEAKSSHDELST